MSLRDFRGKIPVMDPVQCHAELTLYVGERQRQRRAPANQYVIVIPHAFAGLSAGRNSTGT